MSAQHQSAQHQSAQHQSAQHQSAQHQSAQHQSAQHQSAQHQSAQHQTAQHQSAQHQVVVAVSGGPGDEAALQWGVSDAAILHLRVRIVGAYELAMFGSAAVFADPTYVEASRPATARIVNESVARALEINPAVKVEGAAIAGSAIRVLVEESTRASTLVMGSRHRGSFGSAILGSVSSGVASRADCPVVVVRGPAGLAEENPPVVVGVDGTGESQAVLEFAFAQAGWHNRPLHAVLCVHPDLLAGMSWRTDPLVPARAERWLSEALAGWREKYPDVQVRSSVIPEHPVVGLATEALGAYLLVVGNRGRHAIAGTLLGSVSQGLLHRVLCPIAVVPSITR
jgi:nucleotide-binding universal stress UspA family protein